MDPVTAWKTAATVKAVASRLPWKKAAAGVVVAGVGAGFTISSAAVMLTPQKAADAAPAACVTDATPVVGLTPEQAGNAATIVHTGLSLHVPTRGLVVAVATALQESGLRNLGYGDRDSVGLFQQRDAWGPATARMDPAQSAGMFYTGGQGGQRGLLDIPGWETMPVWEAAQRVQVSAYPRAYARWETTALDAVQAVLGGTNTPVNFCQPPTAGGPVGDCPATGNAAERQLTPDAVNVWRCVTAQHPTRYGMGGYGYRPLNPRSDHSTGRAVDIMTGPAGRMPTPQQEAYGWQVAGWLLDNADAFGVKYVIYAGKIRDPGDPAWRPYRHPSGATDPTNMHYDHVHVSVEGTAGTLLTTPTGA